jgi:hypothetical protein
MVKKKKKKKKNSMGARILTDVGCASFDLQHAHQEECV